MKTTKKTGLIFLPLMIATSIVSSPVVAGDSAAGKVIYDGIGACGSCHGISGAGDGVAACAGMQKAITRKGTPRQLK